MNTVEYFYTLEPGPGTAMPAVADDKPACRLKHAHKIFNATGLSSAMSIVARDVLPKNQGMIVTVFESVQVYQPATHVCQSVDRDR